MAERVLTVGTAGHIDHGKTALVHALTGRWTDRLDEEHRRGISIELGFAELPLGDVRLSIVDVPGHERLVRTMVAGATGIDLFLLVVAADDGPMPQTHEHLTVLRALGITSGVCALTKCDLVSDESRAAAAGELGALVPGLPIREVSSKTGEGIAELAKELGRVARGVRAAERPADRWGAPVLHVDRVFTLKGPGTVVTGTLQHGELRPGDRVALLPAGAQSRVRSLQSHDRAVDPARPGSRVAVNLAGTARDQVARGDVVTVARTPVAPTYRLDVELDPGVEAHEVMGKRVQVHHGTRAAPARVMQIAPRLAQLRLEAQLVVAAGDRLVLRRVAPPATLGGAVVLDASPPRHGPGGAERLRLLREGTAEELLARAADADPAVLSDPAQRLPANGLLRAAAHRFATDEWAGAAANLRRKRAAAIPAPAPTAPVELGPLARRVLDELGSEPLRPPALGSLCERLGCERGELTEALGRLVEAGRATRVGSNLYYESEALAGAKDRIVEAARASGSVDVAGVRDLLGTGRKHAQALLEHLDAEKVTLRRGDVHALRRAAEQAGGPR